MWGFLCYICIQLNSFVKFLFQDQRGEPSLEGGPPRRVTPDVFVYAGPDSERISKILQDLVDIWVYSGRQHTDLVNKVGKGAAH